jgi:plasmid maintenance system antidote protein VapI
LARYFSTTPEFWLGLQTRFDLEQASRELDAGIAAIRPRETV